MDLDEQTSSRFFTLFSLACRRVVAEIIERLNQGEKPPRRSYYPDVTKYDPYPNFEIHPPNSPPDYSRMIAGAGLLTPYAGLENLAECENALHFIRDTPDLAEYFSFPSATQKDPTFLFLKCVANTADHYFHVSSWHNSINDSDLSKILSMIGNGILSKDLLFRIIIPFAISRFDFERVRINKRMFITRMSRNLQKARYGCVDHGSGAHQSVVQSSTHALVIKFYHWTGNSNILSAEQSLATRFSYPIAEFDRIFSILRMCSEETLGYAQIFCVPHGWCLDFDADLIECYGFSIRRYPSQHDNFGWMHSHEGLLPEAFQEAGDLIETLNRLDDNRFEVALRRYSTSLLRDNRDDSIIDAAIGLEALMSENSQEIAHKLALRIAALSGLDSSEKRTKAEVFRAVKELYNRRSKIVHGGLSQRRPTPTNVLGEMASEMPDVAATEMLRQLLLILLRNPEYRKPEDVDRLLLLGSA
ncbi:hypothetical protein [Inquilinus sp. OTU3971]|uniref:hypothetical protein n=1 Tax=Inquilinus sp. OTU3971 TaxID=3043855 RepID=UPI00313C7E03